MNASPSRMRERSADTGVPPSLDRCRPGNHRRADVRPVTRGIDPGRRRVDYRQMRVGSQCGTENPEVARFCMSCAAPLAAPAAERRKLATLVFCDVAGSTALGERVDAEVVRGSMLAYFAEA